MGRIILAILFLSLSHFAAEAGQYSDQCSAEGKSAQTKCKETVASSATADSASAATKMKNSDSSINPGAAAQGSQISEQIARLKATKATCETAKKQCEDKCDKAKKAAQSNASARQKGEPKQVDQKKKSDCETPLAALIGELDAALKNLGVDQTNTSSSQNNSNSSPFSMPSTSGSQQSDDDDKSSETASENSANSSAEQTTATAATNTADDYSTKSAQDNAGFAGSETGATKETKDQSANATRESGTNASTNSSSSDSSTQNSKGSSGTPLPTGAGDAMLVEEQKPQLSGGTSNLPTLGSMSTGGSGGGYSENSSRNSQPANKVDPSEFLGALKAEGSQDHVTKPQSVEVSNQFGPGIFSISTKTYNSWCKRKHVCK